MVQVQRSSSHTHSNRGQGQQQQPSPWLQVLAGFLSTALWCFVSSTLIVLNKSLYKGGFPYPMMVTGLGQVCQGVAGYLVCCLVPAVAEAATTYVWQRAETKSGWPCRRMHVLCTLLCLTWGGCSVRLLQQ